MRVAYVLKRYPRYSETFVVNEILAHGAAGLELEIFALRPATDTHFQDAIARVRAPVHYVSTEPVKPSQWWHHLRGACDELPGLRGALEEALDDNADDVHQAVLLAQAARAARASRRLDASPGTSGPTMPRRGAPGVARRGARASACARREARRPGVPGLARGAQHAQVVAAVEDRASEAEGAVHGAGFSRCRKLDC